MALRPSALTVSDLSVVYDREEGPLPAVRAVSLQLDRHESLGLVGESGSGKSTLALGALGYLPANGRVTQGQVLLGDTALTSLTTRELRRVWGSRVGLVSQNPQNALNPSLTVGRQLDEMGRLHLALSRRAAREATLSMLEQVDMPEPRPVADSYPHQLSGGMLQRAAIAMALLTGPELLILDEPTTSLDATTQALVLDLLGELRDRIDSAVVHVTHNLGVVAQVCDRVAVMYAGRLLEQGPTPGVFARPLHPYTANLLACAPRLDADPGSPAATIPGTPPRLDDLPGGCTFAPRCPLALPSCRVSEPLAVEVESGRFSACLRWEVLRTAAGRSAATNRGDPERMAKTAGAPPPATPAPAAPAPAPATETPPSAPLIEVHDVTKRYRGRGKTVTRAVDGVSTRVLGAQTLGLVGESGSGKTTLARVVAGLTAPTTGQVSLDGTPLGAETGDRRKEVLRQMQMVFQNPDASLNPRRTVGQAIIRPLMTLGKMDRGAAAKRAEELLTAVQLPASYLHRYPAALSGGEKQRVAIARAFAASPELVICDEPISSLDVSVQGSLLNLLKDLQQSSGTSYLFISHDLTAVQRLSHQIAVMYQGVLMEYGDGDQVLAPPYHPYTEALLSAIPIPDPKAKRNPVRLSRGQSPTGGIAPGCRFHPRCPRYLGKICETEDPPWRYSTSDGHTHAICCQIPLERLVDLQTVGGQDDSR